VGLSACARGHGIGGELVAAGLQWFFDRGAGVVRVVTQGSNRSAIRLYERAGFSISRVDLWFHWWRGEARA